MSEAQEPSKTDEGQSRLTVGLDRDSARKTFYENADRGEPMHWRDMGPDEVWNAAWEMAIKTEREVCAGICHADYMEFEHGTERIDPQDDYECYLRSSVAKELRDAILKRSNAEIRG